MELESGMESGGGSSNLGAKRFVATLESEGSSVMLKTEKGEGVRDRRIEQTNERKR